VYERRSILTLPLKIVLGMTLVCCLLLQTVTRDMAAGVIWTWLGDRRRWIHNDASGGRSEEAARGVYVTAGSGLAILIRRGAVGEGRRNSWARGEGVLRSGSPGDALFAFVDLTGHLGVPVKLSALVDAEDEVDFLTGAERLVEDAFVVLLGSP
jgi:hypothetical protein